MAERVDACARVFPLQTLNVNPKHQVGTPDSEGVSGDAGKWLLGRGVAGVMGDGKGGEGVLFGGWMGKSGGEKTGGGGGMVLRRKRVVALEPGAGQAKQVPFQSLKPKPETWNAKPDTQNPKPGNRNPEP